MTEPVHSVAVIGGATAGAVVAANLAKRGVKTVVFEQNPRPWGKIEDGLPRWHTALRRKEFNLINERLQTPGVHLVPNTRIGSDIPFAELVNDWGFQAVVLATGAWRDRPLPLEGAEKLLGSGLTYQNSFIYWFNHKNEASYQGIQYATPDGSIVLGGGLASIDVAKVFALETTLQALRERGIEISMQQLEHGGMPKTLAAHGLKYDDLGLKGCTLFYRRRLEDMPLVDAPEGASEDKLAKVQNSRRRIAERAMQQFCFHIEPLSAPESLIVEDDRVVGVRFQRTEVKDGKLVKTGETIERRAPMVVSSIGSVPAPIEGVPMRGELLDFSDWELGRLVDYPTVFGVGNVVTGKGNIVASRKHSQAVSEHIIESYLGLREDHHAGEAAMLNGLDEVEEETVKKIADAVNRQPRLSAQQLEALTNRVEQRQRTVGYDGNYAAWLRSVTPPDLE